MNFAFIPARAGSKGIPHKNIRKLNGTPLIEYAILHAALTAVIDMIIVATDCPQTEFIASKHPKVVVYRRGFENAQDHSTTESVMLEYLEFDKSLSHDDYITLIQATNPFTSPFDINGAYRMMVDGGYESCLSVVEFHRFLWMKGSIPVNYEPLNRPRRQDMAPLYLENGALYINSVGNILRDKCRITEHPAMYVMPPHTKLEIDTEQDWIEAEILYKKCKQ